MIEKLEVSLINENVHNFKKGEFGVEKIEINEKRGLIEVVYGAKEDGIKHVIIPLQNIEKCDYTEKVAGKVEAEVEKK